MVIVAVRDEYSHDVLFFSFQVLAIGNNVVNAGHVFFWHSQAHIYDQDLALAFNNHHIPADLS